MRVLVCGSRTLGGLQTRIDLYDRMAQLPYGTTIMHGDARGIDRMADDHGHTLGFFVKVYPADWETYGKRAGIVRNNEMLDRKPDLVIAIWDGGSRGTGHTIEAARKRNIPVEVIRRDPV